MTVLAHRLASRRSVLLGSGALAGVAMSLGRRARAAGESLTLYNGQHRATTQALVDAFSKDTGIRVATRNAESPELASQIVEEGARSPADAFYSEQSPPIASLDEKGILAPVDPATLRLIPPAYSAKNGTWIGASIRSRVVTYNKAMVQPADLPHSILDFATPAFAGRFGYVKADGFQEQVMSIVRIKGRDVALGWLKGLKQYGRSYNGNRIASTAVENGEIAMALSNNYYWYSLARERGGPDKLASALHFVDKTDPGAIFSVSAAGVLKSSRNQAAAQSFLAYMLSRRGQEAMAATSAEWPVVEDVTSPFPLPALSNFQAPVTPADIGTAAEAYALEREAGLI